MPSKINILPLTPSDENTNTQVCIAAAQNSKEKNSHGIEVISRASISPEYVVVIRTTDPMVVLREKGKIVSLVYLILR